MKFWKKTFLIMFEVLILTVSLVTIDGFQVLSTN